MENTCTCCHNDFTANFCSNCGQKKYKRIDRQYIWDEIQYTFFHINKGFFYTILNVLKNPGKTAREFIDGNRVKHYKPISLAFVLAGVSAFLSIKGIGLYKMMQASSNLNSQFGDNLMSLTVNYNSFFMLGYIPLVALFTKFVFRKWGHNYFEHVVMNAFGVVYYLILCILIMYPILFILKSNPTICVQISQVSFFFVLVFMVWFFKGFYAEKPLKTIILKVLLTGFLLCISFLILMIAGMSIYMAIKGAEGIEYFKAK